MIETDAWPLVQARWYTAPANPRAVRVIVIHDMEYPEKSTAAEEIAHYFATTDTKASAHICVDSDSIVQCVRDSHIAFAAPGCNADGIQIELAGYGRQSREEWLDEYGKKLLENAARAAGQYCAKYTIPPLRLTNTELRSGGRGLVGHHQVSEVYQKSDHTDPGPNFPWDVFIPLVEAHYKARIA